MRFSVDIWPGTDRAAALERAKQEALWSTYSVVISGTTTSGTLRGEIEGSYFVRGDKINFTISKKPSFISDSALKDAVRNFF